MSQTVNNTHKRFYTTDFAFAGTTVDPLPVRSYLLRQKLNYYEEASQRGESNERVLDSLLLTESVEVALRRYMAGHPKTLHKVFSEVREFMGYNETIGAGMVRLVVINMRRDFIKSEWYELMPRFEKAAAKIEHLLKQTK